MDDDGRSLTSQAFSIKIVKLVGDRVSFLARYQRLRDLIRDEADSKREERRRKYLLFSASHLRWYLDDMASRASVIFIGPYDPICAARAFNPIL